MSVLENICVRIRARNCVKKREVEYERVKKWFSKYLKIPRMLSKTIFLENFRGMSMTSTTILLTCERSYEGRKTLVIFD